MTEAERATGVGLRGAPCTHCGTMMEADGTPLDGVPQFCCHGCELAWRIIHEAGLDRYYADRAEPGARPLPAGQGWEQLTVDKLPGGECAATLRVDGLTCVACSWVTERVLTATPGVREATVSYTTGRARIRWSPTETDLGHIASRIAAIGYRPRAASGTPAPDRDLLLRLGVASFAAMNVMLMSAGLYAGWFDGIGAREAGLLRWASLAVATPAALWSAAPLYARAWAGLRHRTLHVDLPVSIGVLAMYIHGVWATMHGEDAWLDSLTMLVALLLAGRVVEAGGRRRAVEAATALAGSVPQMARRVVTSQGGDQVQAVPAESLTPGDVIELATGETAAADGVLVTGTGLLRLALLTGEAEPVPVGPGDRVWAGTLLESGATRVRVTAAGRSTVMSGLARELAQAADRPFTPQLTDRIAPAFTVLTLVIAAATFAGWAWAVDLPTAGRVAMSVLVVACPCALALAAPLATAAGLGASARRGLLVRSGDGLVRMAEVDVVALDKTGTLTAGEPEVVSADDAVLRIAAGLERGSVHPIARAIVAAAAARGIPLPPSTNVVEEAGSGITGVVDGVYWQLGRGGPGEVLLTELGPAVDPAVVPAAGPIGASTGGLVGILRLQDHLRADAAATVTALKARGARVVLLSGDHVEIARRMGEAVGVDEVIGAASPTDKAAWITETQRRGHRVLFVGDGLNDGPALAAAHVGVAMGAGASSSVLVADAVVAVDGLGPVLAGLRAADAGRSAVRGNAFRSLGYNVLAVTAAVFGLVNPLIAAVLMPLSSSLVLWGASRVEARVRREESP